MKKDNFYLEIFLVSLASLLLEVSYTRVFSFKLFYFFTYLIIGLALLGLGSGAVLLTVLPKLKAASTSRVLLLGCSAAGILVGLGYVVIAAVQVNTLALTTGIGQPLRIAAISGFLFVVYLILGILIAKLFTSQPDRINRLYAADLVGAALGCGVSVSLMRLISPPGCIYLSGALFVLAGLRQARLHGTAASAGVVAAGLALLCGALFPGFLPDPIPDQLKTLHPSKVQKILYSKWDPVFRIDVTPSMSPDMLIIDHDALLGSTLHKFDGDLKRLTTKFVTDSRALPFSVARNPGKVLIIGAAGGHEILASLYFGSKEVTGVELNPATVSLVHGPFADFTGHLYRYPGVNYLNGEGRSYLAGQSDKYDVIFFVAPDSYAAMNAASAGAFVLSESYLYTVGMIELSLRHLTDDGIICMQFGEISFATKPNRSSRYVATAREAFRRLGVDDFDKHVIVNGGADLFNPATILLKRQPFTEEEAARFLETSAKVPGKPVYVPGRVASEGPITSIITMPYEQLRPWFRSYRYNVAPVYDDSPFFWHFVRFRDVLLPRAQTGLYDFEESIGERLLLTLLGVAATYALVFLLLPFIFIRRKWLELPFKGKSALYFATLGTGFMFFEIVLIQKLTLLLGYPTYSLSVTLMSLLVFTGIGSFLTTRYTASYRTALLVLMAILTAATLFYQFAMDHVVAVALPTPIALRVALAIVMILPLGLCLGGFMPIGLAVVAEHTVHKEEYVAWGWAVNGFCSVLSSILATVLSMTLGFTAVMYIALALYWMGTSVFRTVVPAVARR